MEALVLTIAEVRAALGDVAVGKSDEDIERIRDEFMTFARALVGVSMGRMQDLPMPAVRPRLVRICSYCPDAKEQTAAARAHGLDTTHVICAPCHAKVHADLDAREQKAPCV